MKMNFLKISLLSLFVSAFTFVACEKDDDTPSSTIKSQIVGTWDFTSFKVDGDEMIGVVVDSSTVRFQAYTGAQGNFDQTIVYADGERDQISGKYSVNETKKEVTMIAGGETEIAKINFGAAGKMDWNATQDGEPVVAKLARR